MWLVKWKLLSGRKTLAWVVEWSWVSCGPQAIPWLWKTFGLLLGWGVSMDPTREQLWLSLTRVEFLLERGEDDSGLPSFSTLEQTKATMTDTTQVHRIYTSTRLQPTPGLQVLIARGWAHEDILPEEVETETPPFFSLLEECGYHAWLTLYIAQICSQSGRRWYFKSYH